MKQDDELSLLIIMFALWYGICPVTPSISVPSVTERSSSGALQRCCSVRSVLFAADHGLPVSCPNAYTPHPLAEPPLTSADQHCVPEWSARGDH